jgi:hypothetical protein
MSGHLYSTLGVFIIVWVLWAVIKWRQSRRNFRTFYGPGTRPGRGRPYDGSPDWTPGDDGSPRGSQQGYFGGSGHHGGGGFFGGGGGHHGGGGRGGGGDSGGGHHH